MIFLGVQGRNTNLVRDSLQYVTQILPLHCCQSWLREWPQTFCIVFQWPLQQFQGNSHLPGSRVHSSKALNCKAALPSFSRVWQQNCCPSWHFWQSKEMHHKNHELERKEHIYINTVLLMNSMRRNKVYLYSSRLSCPA